MVGAMAMCVMPVVVVGMGFRRVGFCSVRVVAMVVMTVRRLGVMGDGMGGVAVIGGVAMSVMPMVVMGVAVRSVGPWRVGVVAMVVMAVRRLGVVGDVMGVVAMIGGMAMSGVAVAWSMSSLVFAGEEDGALYQGIHVTLTGFRGLLGPLLGLLIMQTLGWSAAFWIAGGLLFVASALMQRQGVELDQRLPHPPAR